jgi:hypothetical protein
MVRQSRYLRLSQYNHLEILLSWLGIQAGQSGLLIGLPSERSGEQINCVKGALAVHLILVVAAY